MTAGSVQAEKFEHLLRDMIGLSSDTVGTSVIRHALMRRMNACGMPDLDAYWSHLSDSRTERQELIDCVVVPETWFFRDREAFNAMSRHAGACRARHRPLRLLSVPCSTGEEPYSMAMALLDAGYAAQQFGIDAVDVSTRNLAHAERAIYGRNSFRGGDLAFRDRHFETLDHGFRPMEAVRRQVRFTLGNLLDPAMQPGQDVFDIIFCRNLLIYFDRETQAVALKRLRDMLADDGLLLVGPAESGLPSLHGFASVRLPRAFAFAKAEPTPTPEAKALLPKKVQPNRAPVSPRPRGGRPPAGPRPFAQNAGPDQPAATVAVPGEATADLALVEDAANAGRLSEARAAAERHIVKYGPSPDAFYFLGLAQDADGAAEDAARNYRKALYLAPDHHQALAQLRLLLQRQGDRAGAGALADRLERLSKRSVS